jgi:hypothetical protein
MITVYVLIECEACEGDVIIDVYASLESAQAARPGPWRQLGAAEALFNRWTTRREGGSPWFGSWHAIESFGVHP